MNFHLKWHLFGQRTPNDVAFHEGKKQKPLHSPVNRNESPSKEMILSSFQIPQFVDTNEEECEFKVPNKENDNSTENFN